jgi:RAB protein geranylgeranyltransferase component A
MAEPDLPFAFDVVVVGTGLTESIFAGACARAGKSVLHLDHNAHYGARQATHSLKDFALWLRGELLDAADEQRLERADPSLNISAAEEVEHPVVSVDVLVTHVPDTPHRVAYIGPSDYPASAGWSELPATAELPADLQARSSRFSVDVTPQLIRCGGPMVDGLRSSGVASYLEFKPVTLHAYHDGDSAAPTGGGASQAVGPSGLPESPLRRVPCTKGDIFKSSSIALSEKRQLMKFLQSCAAMQPALEPHIAMPPQAAAAPDAPPAPPPAIGSTFADFCQASRLSAALRDMATYALLHHPGATPPSHAAAASSAQGTAAEGDNEAVDVPSARDGIIDVCRHLRSLGKFGPTAYLAPFYGSSELPQAFCRLCAVWGGTYMLTRRAYALRTRGGQVMAVADASGRWIGCKWVLLNADNQLVTPSGAAAAETDGSSIAGGGAGGAVIGGGSSARPATAPRLCQARCVAILDGPLLGAPGEELAFASLLPGVEAGPTPVFVLQQDSSSGVCPPGRVLLHLSTEAPLGIDPQQRLNGALAMLFRQRRRQVQMDGETAASEVEAGEGALSDADTAPGDGHSDAEPTAAAAPLRVPTLLWGAFFSLPMRPAPSAYSSGVPSVDALPDAAGMRNLLALGDARIEPTSDQAVSRARALFERVCPGAAFLPPREEEEADGAGVEAAEGGP